MSQKRFPIKATSERERVCVENGREIDKFQQQIYPTC